MKKILIFISVMACISCMFVSCCSNSENDNTSNTFVTDKQGSTHYNEIISDYGTTHFDETIANSKEKTVTVKNDTYVTNEYSTNSTKSMNNTTLSTTTKVTESLTSTSHDKAELDDNVVDFDTTTELSITTQITSATVTTTTKNNTIIEINQNEKENSTFTESTTKKIVADKEGWIDKWY